MKTSIFLFLGTFLVSFSVAHAQDKLPEKKRELKMYLIERDIPNAGQFSSEELQSISQTSCDVLDEMDPKEIKWIESYVTDDKIYCRYWAKNEELLRDHAEKGEFPITKIILIHNKIDSSTADVKS